jgi:site-specific DNA-methyltransferase (adenine-specific)
VVDCGDALKVLRDLPDASFRTAITSPPYWSLRDYSVTDQLGLENDPDDYVASLVCIFDEVQRVLTEDGSLWLNIGIRTHPVGEPGERLTRRIRCEQ